MMDVVLVIVSYAAVFLAGYGLRAYISWRHRAAFSEHRGRYK
jgi:hypothetical protein